MKKYQIIREENDGNGGIINRDVVWESTRKREIESRFHKMAKGRSKAHTFIRRNMGWFSLPSINIDYFIAIQ